MMFSPGTIIAKSTGEGSAALAVLRISGFSDLKLFESLFSVSVSKFIPRKAVLVSITENNKLLDEVIATFFPAPNSFTGENLLELSVHGNPVNVDRLLHFFCQNFNCRLAQPGEFTFRALKNKKLDLTQVEALDMILTSKSLQGVELGLKGLNGTIHSAFISLREEFIKFRILVELLIDFAEDVGERETVDRARVQFSQLKKTITNLNTRASGQTKSLLSPSIVLFGTPNSGKSTFFNYLLGHDRSIVSPEAGTTRDYVSESFQLGSHHFNLIDTAGVRESENSIEMKGVERSFGQYKDAFFKIAVINPLDFSAPFLELLKTHSVDCFILTHLDKIKGFSLSKSPLLAFINEQKTPIFLTSGPIEPQGFFGPIEPLFLAGPIEPELKTGPIEPLQNFYQIVSLKLENALATDPILVPRQQETIRNIYNSINNIEVNLLEEDILIFSNEINVLSGKIEELIGLVSPDDVLNNLFSNFCIGK